MVEVDVLEHPKVLLEPRLPHQLLSYLQVLRRQVLQLEVQLELLRLYWRRHSLRQHVRNADPAEPLVLQYLSHSVSEPQPLRRVLVQQPRHQVLDLARQVAREGDRLVQNRVVYLLRVFAVERRQARHQLVQQRPQAVVIHLQPVPLLQQHLRRHVLWTPAERVGVLVG